MVNHDDLLTEAEQRLEENRYAEAANLFQQAAEKREPTMVHLANWAVAQDQVRLSFLRFLSSKYPNSIDCQMGLATQLLRMGMKTQAAAHCTHVLTLFQDQEAVLQARLLRLRAGIDSKQTDHVVEDFLWIWHARLSETGVVLLRSRLLRDIARVQDDILLPALEELKNHESIKGQAGVFISAKIQELVLLKATTDSLVMSKPI
jgi:hypothetical protein